MIETVYNRGDHVLIPCRIEQITADKYGRIQYDLVIDDGIERNSLVCHYYDEKELVRWEQIVKGNTALEDDGC